MFRKLAAFGTTAVSSMAIGHYSIPSSIPSSKDWPSLSLSPLTSSKTQKEFNIPISTIVSLSLCSTVGMLYWKGFGFADIAYATRRSVATLTVALEKARKSILSRITTLEKTFESRSDKIEDKIADEARKIRNDIEALHNDQTNLHKDQKKMGSDVTEINKKVTEINKKVANVELLSTLSSRGVSLLCTTLDKNKYINSTF